MLLLACACNVSISMGQFCLLGRFAMARQSVIVRRHQDHCRGGYAFTAVILATAILLLVPLLVILLLWLLLLLLMLVLHISVLCLLWLFHRLPVCLLHLRVQA